MPWGVIVNISIACDIIPMIRLRETTSKPVSIFRMQRYRHVSKIELARRKLISNDSLLVKRTVACYPPYVNIYMLTIVSVFTEDWFKIHLTHTGVERGLR